MIKRFVSILLLCLCTPALASEYVAHQFAAGDFVVADSAREKTATIWVDRKANPGIRMAAESLQQDILRVTGLKPRLTSNTEGLSGHVIIIGERGQAALVDKLIGSNQLTVQAKARQWEGYQLDTVANPLPGS